MVGEDKPKKPRTKPRTSDVRIDLGAPYNPARLAHSGSRRRAARAVIPDERFLVRTEFVFADMKAHKDVKLCGDWCKWEPISMELEQEGTWSVITIVPCGYREFCYIVDGEYTISQRHPTNTEGTCNWRTVHGPPSLYQSRRPPEPRNRILRFADSAADHLRNVILYYTNRGQLPDNSSLANGRRCGHLNNASLPEVESDTYAQPSASRLFKKYVRVGNTIRMIAFLTVLCGCYFFTTMNKK